MDFSSSPSSSSSYSRYKQLELSAAAVGTRDHDRTHQEGVRSWLHQHHLTVVSPDTTADGNTTTISNHQMDDDYAEVATITTTTTTTGDNNTTTTNNNNNNPKTEAYIEREHMFDKVVTPSDVGKLNRLVIPKQHAEKYFPLDTSSNEKGLLLNFEDRSGKAWRFRYSYWNSSQSYVMTKGWSRFVKEKKLDAGDIISFQRGIGELVKDRFFIDWRRRQLPEMIMPPLPPRLLHLQGYESPAGAAIMFPGGGGGGGYHSLGFNLASQYQRYHNMQHHHQQLLSSSSSSSHWSGNMGQQVILRPPPPLLPPPPPPPLLQVQQLPLPPIRDDHNYPNYSSTGVQLKQMNNIINMIPQYHHPGHHHGHHHPHHHHPHHHNVTVISRATSHPYYHADEQLHHQNYNGNYRDKEHGHDDRRRSGMVVFPPTGSVDPGRGGGGGGCDGVRKEPSRVYEMVPVVQPRAAAAPKQLRLFGVNMDCCSISQADHHDIAALQQQQHHPNDHHDYHGRDDRDLSSSQIAVVSQDEATNSASFQLRLYDDGGPTSLSTRTTTSQMHLQEKGKSSSSSSSLSLDLGI